MAIHLTRSTQQSTVRKAHTAPPSQLAQTDAHPPILAMQQTLGNQAVSQLLQPSGSISSGTAVDRGQPLDPLTRAQMESRFEQDFSQVQIHTDSRAAASAKAMNALAYTVGQHIVFGAGQFAPETLTGQRLLAHELTHTLQQRQPGLARSIASQQSPAHEREATRSAEAALQGAPIGVNTAAPIGVARQPIPGSPIPDPPVPGSIDLTELASPMMARAIGSVTIDQFALGSATIPSKREGELRRTAKQIVKLLKRYPGSTIRVTGHTDTVGAPERNQALGLDRATAVQDILVEEGVPDKLLEVTSKGETAPAVPTKDDKPEGRNRRVVVQFEPREPLFPSMLPDLMKPPPSLGKPFEKPSIDVLPKLPPNSWELPKPGPRRDPPPAVPDWMWKEIPDPFKDFNNRSFQDVFREGFSQFWSKFSKIIPEGKLRKWVQEKGEDIADAALEGAIDKALDQVENLDGKTKDAIKAALKAATQAKKRQPDRTPPPSREPPPSSAPEYQPAPGEKIFKLPPIRF
jgi:outer membrane protein OmpA-like peptidoglycan-associated protein